MLILTTMAAVFARVDGVKKMGQDPAWLATPSIYFTLEMRKEVVDAAPATSLLPTSAEPATTSMSTPKLMPKGCANAMLILSTTLKRLNYASPVTISTSSFNQTAKEGVTASTAIPKTISGSVLSANSSKPTPSETRPEAACARTVSRTSATHA